jgi:outer membrane protein OmpA-like peptidoglycan-associated protein
MKKILYCLFLWNSLLLTAQNGLLGEYYNGKNFEEKKGERTDDKLNFYWNFESPMLGIAAEAFSIRWTGKLVAPESGKFLVSLTVDDGCRMWLDDQQIINAWGLHDKERFSNYIYLEKDKSYNIKIEYFNGTREGMIDLKWQLPSEKPLFGGMFGNNEKVITSKYLTAKEKKVVITENKVEKKDKIEPIKEVPKKAEIKPKIQVKPTPKPTIPPKDTVQKYTPKNILFDKGKTVMIGNSEAELDRLAAMLQRYATAQLLIEGHTDNIGDVAMNQTLSEQRAEAVKTYLIKKGVAVSRLTAKGFGGSRPIYKNGNEKNRRVEFIINSN